MSNLCDVKEQVLAELRMRKIKLWLPPYYIRSDGSDRAALQLLQDLAADFADGPIDSTKDEILASLIVLQQHALDKLNQKRRAPTTAPAVIECLELKLLGLQRDLQSVAAAASPPCWAERLEVSGKVLKIFRVDSSLTADAFCKDVVELLEVDSLRLVYRGRSIVTGDLRQLKDIIPHDRITFSTRREEHVAMMCLTYHKTQGENADRTLVSSIRQAATKLGATTVFDVTDQHGKHVPMLPVDRLAFLTALGLHRIGRKRMDDSNLPSALIFFMEADHEWSKVAQHWQDAVDNYGLLQLDIAWVYLKLESIDNLPDVVRRLDIAEKTLRKQVDSNFVTLALVQADMGNPVPPLSSIFCRLFLLQGIAYQFSQDKEKSQERLDWAFSLCQSLRIVSTSEQIRSLCDALGVTRFQAISALRRTNGDLNLAATLMETEKVDEELQNLRRAQQTMLGLCQNTVDYVDLDLVLTLGEILGFIDLQPQHGTQGMDPDFVVVAGLLRLSNNNLEKAIDIFQTAQRSPQVVLGLVFDLDKTLVTQGFAKANSPRNESRRKVDEVELATLLSMGIDESLAKQALQNSENNAEQALVWVTGPGQLEENLDDSASYSAMNSNSVVSHEGEGSLAKRAKLEIEEIEEAEQLLKVELGDALQERDMEEEYIGSTLDEEWDFINRFRA